ncbi:hypothetical protein [Solicola sp. PLA-1-18]|uniref:hypothetical protein n=1 Tax=Solicola sp. PLA-1-18 TaxID=3380532 RepID=UPI003B7C9810
MRRILLVVLTVAVTVGLAGAPASAQTKVRKDKIGDAPANVDIRSAKVQNNASKLAVTVRFQKVQKRRTSLAVSFLPGSLDELTDSDSTLTFYSLSSEPVSGGRYSARLVRISFDGSQSLDDLDEQRVRCPGLSARWKRGTRGFARVVVPQSCLGADAGRQVMAVTSFDKKAIASGLAVRQSLRGDLSDDEIPIDFIDSPISTRRG